MNIPKNQIEKGGAVLLPLDGADAVDAEHFFARFGEGLAHFDERAVAEDDEGGHLHLLGDLAAQGGELIEEDLIVVELFFGGFLGGGLGDFFMDEDFCLAVDHTWGEIGPLKNGVIP